MSYAVAINMENKDAGITWKKKKKKKTMLSSDITIWHMKMEVLKHCVVNQSMLCNLNFFVGYYQSK